MEVELAWTWLFDDAKTAPTVTNTVSFTQIDDKLDTVLGDIKADTDELTFTGNSSTDISYKFKMTATQID